MMSSVQMIKNCFYLNNYLNGMESSTNNEHLAYTGQRIHTNHIHIK